MKSIDFKKLITAPYETFVKPAFDWNLTAEEKKLQDKLVELKDALTKKLAINHNTETVPLHPTCNIVFYTFHTIVMQRLCTCMENLFPTIPMKLLGLVGAIGILLLSGLIMSYLMTRAKVVVIEQRKID